LIARLIWKEWVEQRWKLALCCVLLVGFSAAGLRARVAADLAVCVLAAFGGCLLLPIFVGMDLLASERAEGSLISLLALPVSSHKILAVKLLIGCGTIVGYMLAACTTICLMAGGREIETGRIISLFAGCTGVGVALLIWMTCLAVRQVSEARCAVVGIVVLVVWVFTMFGFDFLGSFFMGGWSPPKWLPVIHPVALLEASQSSWHWSIVAVGIQVLWVVLLFLWAASRLGRMEGPQR
jgi:ABC-type transport system involved in multi-copper enzyme maturation permease subunit